MKDDDIVYGKKPLGPRVVHVVPNDDYTLTLTFTNGEVKRYDMNPLLDKGIFRELQNIGYFRCVRVNAGTVEWPNEQDICPDVLYMDSEVILS
ncbi:MAG: DUF2442 domain-containing protein [Planctomycetaceae bacterium]|jgi:hypothetical protein|nr:DUF2442 domain-containing protein [Planctomycetaceae bacterium]